MVVWPYVGVKKPARRVRFLAHTLFDVPEHQCYACLIQHRPHGLTEQTPSYEMSRNVPK